MDQQVQFILYAVQQRWLTEEQARDLWLKRQNQEDEASIDQLALNEKLLDEEQVNQGREVVGMELAAEALKSIGKYDLSEFIGSGCHGVVFRGQPELDKEIVAVKVLAPRLHDDLLYLEHFTEQAKAAQIHELEHVASTIESGEDQGHYYLVSEYVEGEGLDVRVNRDGALPEEEVIRMAMALTRALAHADENDLAHGGIRPADVRFTSDGDIELCDMGLAKEVQDHLLLQMAFSMGAEHYFSPEQVQGDEGDILSDLFSLGAVLYFAATGTSPFAGERALAVLSQEESAPHIPSPAEQNPALSENFCKVLARLMAAAPEDRYPTPEDLLEDLESLAAGNAPAGAEIDEAKSLMALSVAAGEAAEETEMAEAAEEPEESEQETVPVPAASEDETSPPKEGETSPPAEEKTPAKEQEAPTEKTSPVPPTRRATAGTARRATTGTARRATAGTTRRRHSSAARKQSLGPMLAIGIPIVLILVGLAFVFSGAGSSSKKPVPAEPPSRKIDPVLEALTKELREIQGFMRDNPTQIDEARAKLVEYQKKVQANPIMMREVRKAFAQLTKLARALEQARAEKEKEKLKSEVPATNLASNPSFDVGTGTAPEGWELHNGAGDWIGKDAADGTKCVSLSVPDGAKQRSPYWEGSASPIEPQQPYKVSFKYKTDLWRHGENAYFDTGSGWVSIEPNVDWEEKTFIFVPPNRAAVDPRTVGGSAYENQHARLRLGVWSRPGTVFFDAVRIVKVSPYNKKYKNIELSAGEEISSRSYQFHLRPHAPQGNYARCLQDFSASFLSRGWEFTRDQFVSYTHQIGDLGQKNGFLTVGCEYVAQGAELKVEVSKDGANWVTFATLKKKEAKADIMPESVYPAKVMYVKLTASGHCRVNKYSYRAELDGNPPRRFVGSTEFIE